MRQFVTPAGHSPLPCAVSSLILLYQIDISLIYKRNVAMLFFVYRNMIIDIDRVFKKYPSKLKKKSLTKQNCILRTLIVLVTHTHTVVVYCCWSRMHSQLFCEHRINEIDEILCKFVFGAFAVISDPTYHHNQSQLVSKFKSPYSWGDRERDLYSIMHVNIRSHRSKHQKRKVLQFGHGKCFYTSHYNALHVCYIQTSHPMCCMHFYSIPHWLPLGLGNTSYSLSHYIVS